MVTQGQWDKDSALMRLPHVDKACAVAAGGLGSICV